MGGDWQSARVMVPHERREAAAIFLGTVVGVDTLARDSMWIGGDSSPGRRPIISARTVRYRFAVGRVWKGKVGPAAVIMNDRAGTSCSRDYKLDGMYLVYAERDHGMPSGLMTYACSRVKPEGDIQDDLQVLGPGKPPKK